MVCISHILDEDILAGFFELSCMYHTSSVCKVSKRQENIMRIILIFAFYCLYHFERSKMKSRNLALLYFKNHNDGSISSVIQSHKQDMRNSLIARFLFFQRVLYHQNPKILYQLLWIFLFLGICNPEIWIIPLEI